MTKFKCQHCKDTGYLKMFNHKDRWPSYMQKNEPCHYCQKKPVQVFDGDGVEPPISHRPNYVDVVVVTGNARYQGEIDRSTYYEMTKLKIVPQLTLWDNNVPMMECGNVSIKKNGLVVELHAEKVSWVRAHE